MRNWVFVIRGLGLCFALVPSAAHAGAIIVNPGTNVFTAATASLAVDNHYSGAVATRMTDYSGLSGSASTLATGAAVPTTWPADNSTGHTGADYLSNNVQAITITFDLGKVYTLGDGTNSFHVYNYNEGVDTPMPANTNGHDRGVLNVSIYYETSGSLTDPTSSFSLASANQSFPDAPGTDAYTGNNYTQLNGISARFVRFVVTSNWNSTTGTGQGAYTGLSEVRFIATVPEPSTLMLLGAGALGLFVAARRRRTSQTREFDECVARRQSVDPTPSLPDRET